ncbi:MAG: hypothetical protein R6V14_01535 [Halanaerobiales bacterium]
MLGKSVVIAMLIVTILTSLLFAIVLIQDGVGNPLLNQTAEVGNNIITNTSQQAQLTERANNYDDIKLSYDYVFFVGFLLFEALALLLAVASPKIPNFTFISFLFLGTIFILFFYPLIMQIDSYLYEVFFNDIFNEVVLVIPFYNFVMNNQYIIFALNLIILVAINKMFGRDESLADNPAGVSQ